MFKSHVNQDEVLHKVTDKNMIVFKEKDRSHVKQTYNQTIAKADKRTSRQVLNTYIIFI